MSLLTPIPKADAKDQIVPMFEVLAKQVSEKREGEGEESRTICNKSAW